MYNEHEDKDIMASIIRLSDALCQWERGTGRESVLILREQGGYAYRAQSGKPNVPNFVTDDQLIDMVCDFKNPPDDSDRYKVFKLIKKFIIKNKIHSAETVYQSDHVIENAYEFIESLCEIVGYYDID